MVLSERLLAVSSLVTEGSRLADIGTDHGFVPIFLVESGRIPSAVAMDVNAGPLERAREHIALHALEEKIVTRLSDGLDALGKEEADTVLIAGMGGALTVRILDRRRDLPAQVKELVLQPQSEIALVRRYLERSGWKIVREKMVREDGKYYPMMRCIPGLMHLTTAQACFGPCLMEERPAVWIDFLKWRKSILERNLARLENARGERGRVRRGEILQETAALEELLFHTATTEYRTGAGPEACGPDGKERTDDTQ